jgi:hypothetical protein
MPEKVLSFFTGPEKQEKFSGGFYRCSKKNQKFFPAVCRPDFFILPGRLSSIIMGDDQAVAADLDQPVRNNAEEPPGPVTGPEPEFPGGCHRFHNRPEPGDIVPEFRGKLLGRCQDSLREPCPDKGDQACGNDGKMIQYFPAIAGDLHHPAQTGERECARDRPAGS